MSHRFKPRSTRIRNKVTLVAVLGLMLGLVVPATSAQAVTKCTVGSPTSSATWVENTGSIKIQIIDQQPTGYHIVRTISPGYACWVSDLDVVQVVKPWYESLKNYNIRLTGSGVNLLERDGYMYTDITVPTGRGLWLKATAVRV